MTRLPSGNCLMEKHLRDLNGFHLRVQSKREGMSVEIAVRRKHKTKRSSSSVSGVNCMLSSQFSLKSRSSVLQNIPLVNAGPWTFPCLFALLLYIDFCIFLVQVSRHATFPSESQPVDATEIQLRVSRIEHIEQYVMMDQNREKLNSFPLPTVSNSHIFPSFKYQVGFVGKFFSLKQPEEMIISLYRKTGHLISVLMICRSWLQLLC